MDIQTWYIYNVETNNVVRKFNGILDDAEDIYSTYDKDLFAMTNTPAFGCVDDLN